MHPHSGNRMLTDKKLIISIYEKNENNILEKSLIFYEDMEKFLGKHIDDVINLYDILNESNKKSFNSMFRKDKLFKIMAKTETNDYLIVNVLVED